MAKATTTELIREWLERVCAVERPAATIVAYNVGLFEARRGYTAYLIGATAFDDQNSDWACRVAFRPRERERPLAAREHADWEQALATVSAAVRDFLASPAGVSSFLGQAIAVTVGFDDGDLVRVR